ncbi:MAG: 7-carboxy-7-deazaguanine synthase QueE [Bacteroidales bacterium]|nr:7-carboxy-7-deazaguanine synthase QueE [Bacteroidales bacterium]MDD4001535.1 7-carboxy-7-deazaguanine synthase QueE [Bacteroidales bacterium]MDD4528854.1 7-carboxy-7-deazaguanine synthase QueE [Bacteroidales bacterium]MDD4830056.1 7-carboxy-7-deazaguanine synthase QueE [Bacteroidales bacterium]
MTQEQLIESGKLLPIMEEFYSLQGEGYNTGKAAYFIRVGGCDVGCDFCDVKEAWDAALLAPTNIEEVVRRAIKFPAKSAIITGGEPLLYNLDPLCEMLHQNNIETILETSGSSPMSGSWDWICLSAKRNIPPIEANIKYASELKMIISDEKDFAFAETYSQKVDNSKCFLYLQPEWSVRNIIMPKIIEYIKMNPKWRISLQSHKYMQIP